MKQDTKHKLRELVLFKPDFRTIIIMCLGAIYNVAGHYLAGHFDLPFWLDNIGTMAISIAFGPLAGIILSIFSQLLYGLPMGLPLPYYSIGIMMAIVVGLFFPRKHREDVLAIVTIGVLAAVVTSLVSCPLNLYYYGGKTHNLWGDSLLSMLSRSVNLKSLNSYLAVAFIDLPDRVVTVFLALFLVDIEETRIFKKQQRSVTRSSAGLLALIVGLSFMSVNYRALRAFDFDSDFDTIVYDTDNGILTSEVNAVAQTRDGYLWVGSYAGLYKFNGVRFHQADVDSRIRNVMTLYVDMSGKLWIGTNDSGVFCYDPNTEEVKLFDSGNGLEADSVRSICEDNNGNIYVGTFMSISKITPDGTVKTFREWDKISYCTSMDRASDGTIIGVTNSGILFTIKDDMLTDLAECDLPGNIAYRAVACSNENILVTTTGNVIERYNITDDKLTRTGSFSIEGHSYFSNIKYSSEYGGFFYCGNVGFGFIDEKTWETTDMTEDDFSGTTSDVCVDDQGNVWFSSSKHGLLKCAHTPFRSLFKKAGLDNDVVNAVFRNEGLVYVGADHGVFLFDEKSAEAVDKPWARSLSGARIRHFMTDSKGNLWISSYDTKPGLFRISPDDTITCFNEESGMLGSKMRSCIELSDGRILAASNKGLSFIKDDQVVATIGNENGLKNQYILSMYEREDGTVLAASDGDGIYIIKNDRVAGHISEEEGLTTSVVMRIVKGTSGFFYVTSDSIYFDDGNAIRELKNFPFTNNYDILISDDGMCWITSSAGLFLIDEKTMAEDGNYTCTLLNKNWGLNTTFTANSWNIFNDGTLYLCCTDGVRVISTDNYMSKDANYQIHLESITQGDIIIHEMNGKFVIPAKSDRISFNVAVTNYSLSNPLVRYYLEGANDNGITCHQNEIQPLEFTSLGYGNYKLHIQVLNEATGAVEREAVFTIRKEAMMFEKLYFRIYLLFVASFVAFYVIWLLFTINKRASKIRGLQKEMSTDPMTGLYNKAASERILARLCSENTGILMMIDLDSFKLVNDIYGHEMGDRILIRFGELITEAVGEGNMGGRLGGDEFIGFIKNTIDENDVDQITRYLNREIIQSAKEYMGSDMNIPLGASIGAVRVPTEGKEFDDLFRYADKALYVVKQNGKHGYAFYQKNSENRDLDPQNSDNNNIERIKKIIGERNEGKGAYLVNFDRLQVIYKFLNRDNKVSGTKSGFVRISIKSPDENIVADEIKDSFEEALIVNLKKNDVVSRYSGHFFIIFSNGDSKNYREIIERIVSAWKATGNYEKYQVDIEVESVG